MKWLGLVFILLLIVIFCTGCNQWYSEADLDALRQEATDGGYAQGYSTGYTEGFSKGHDKGADSGKNVGYELGKTDGYEFGYDEGYEEGQSEGYEAGGGRGYELGYAEGYDAGITELKPVIEEAEKLGYEKGYEAGIEAAKQEAQTVVEAKHEVAIARLDDLAYIKASMLFTYSDDADPEPEGVYLTIYFYDSKSKPIFASGVPIDVSFKIYDVSGETSTPTPGYDPLIYNGSVSINSTTDNIKIPFYELYKSSGRLIVADRVIFVTKWLEVTVTTPNQEEFSVVEKAVWLE